MARPQAMVDIYDDRPVAAGQFRLIHLHPGRWSDKIDFDLVCHSLDPDTIPFYEAVSYSWGSAQRISPVYCSGHGILVTESAGHALQRFRFSDRKRLLWIDAICINQEDLAERSQQIAQMGMIYGQSSRVLIFLGNADEDSDDAMEAIAGGRMATGKQQRAIVHLLKSRLWFKRVWVLQEVALADCAFAVCGSKCIPWTRFREWWARNGPSLRDLVEPPPTLVHNPPRPTGSSLLQQLQETRLSQATDPRDKIYGLLGLLPPDEISSFSVNYEQSVSSLFSDTAIAIIRREQSLRILSCVFHQAGADLGLPSWVPDWDSNLPLSSLGLCSTLSEAYNAGGKPACGVAIESPPGQLPILSCRGIRLGEVKCIGDLCTAPDEAIANVLSSWDELIRDQISSGSTLITPVEPWDTATLALIDLGRRLSIPGLVDEGRYSSDYCSNAWERFRNTCGIRSSKGEFFPFPHTSAQMWPIMLARPSPALELVPGESALGNSVPPTLEGVKFCLGRKLLITNNGFVGLAPAAAEPGDVVVVLLGAPVPHVLRERGGEVKLVGECYVYGVMDGEAIAHLCEPGHRSRPFPKSKSSSPLETFQIR